MEEKKRTIEALRARTAELLDRLDISVKEQEAAKLEKSASESSFWDDREKAQATMRRLAAINEEIGLWRDLEKRIETLNDLVNLSMAEEDSSLEEQLDADLEEVRGQIERLEIRLALSGKYDGEAAILALHAGAGGTESQDWVEILLRMYLRWAERRGDKTQILDMSPGEEAGIKSVTVEIDGDSAYGYLKSERGVHRLVRISPFDASHLRHTSFALVEVLPRVDEDVDVTISPDDLKTDVFKASGAGGQHVQKNLTAVRITHLPTGIVVTCQNERSQLQNRETAMRILRARLLEKELERRAVEQADLKGEHVEAGWGNQIRSYVLHPYKQVRDHRSGYESTNADAILDGDLDDMLVAYLKSSIGEKDDGH
ncbi:MAG: peptide chain release factor 2 [Dehalococcoidia bacterium]